MLIWLLACSGGPDLSEDLVHLQRSVELWEESQAHLEENRLEEALEVQVAAIALNPESPELWLGKGHILASMGRYQAAVKAASTALRLRRDWADAHYNRACWGAQAGMLERAASDLRVAFESGGSFRLEAARDGDLDPLRQDPDFAELIPDRALPSEVFADDQSFFRGSEWEVGFRFLNRPGGQVLLTWRGTGGFPARHTRSVEDIWEEDGVSAHDLRVVFRVLGEGKGRLGPWLIEAAGLSKELDPQSYLFRQPPNESLSESVDLVPSDFWVPSTVFASLDLHAPVRRGDRVLVKTLPGEQVEWAAAWPVQHELRRQGQTQWVGWEAQVPPNAEVILRRGGLEIWSGRL